MLTRSVPKVNNVMNNGRNYIDRERLRAYASVFSRNVFYEIIRFGDFSKLDTMLCKYDCGRDFSTYYDYIRYAYRVLSKNYRCEYIYKNELINKLLIKKYGTKDSVAISEFRAGDSIVDLAVFNGESKAFEIKTEYDSDRRLGHQLKTYAKMFQRCYLVISEKLLDSYLPELSTDIGIIVLKDGKSSLQLEEIRSAGYNGIVDSDVIMRSVRTCEYKNIVASYYGMLPDVSRFDIFDRCKEMMKDIPPEELHRLFVTEIKKRKSVTAKLRHFPVELRQICLSMNIDGNAAGTLFMRLNLPINHI